MIHKSTVFINPIIIYMVYKDTYFLAIQVSQPFSFSKKVAKHYYKVEISNNPNNKNKAKGLKELLESKKFIEQENKTISKPNFFKSR